MYQLYLQRVHNEKSLKPLVQIDLTDQARILAIDVQNNGVGPLTIEAITFRKDGKTYPRIQDCLTFDPRHYEHWDVDADNKKVLVPGGKLEAFSKAFAIDALEQELDDYRKQLSVLIVTVQGRDIYDNKILVSKRLAWFGRYVKATF